MFSCCVTFLFWEHDLALQNEVPLWHTTTYHFLFVRQNLTRSICKRSTLFGSFYSPVLRPEPWVQLQGRWFGVHVILCCFYPGKFFQTVLFIFDCRWKLLLAGHVKWVGIRCISGPHLCWNFQTSGHSKCFAIIASHSQSRVHSSADGCVGLGCLAQGYLDTLLGGAGDQASNLVVASPTAPAPERLPTRCLCTSCSSGPWGKRMAAPQISEDNSTSLCLSEYPFKLDNDSTQPRQSSHQMEAM